VRYYPEMVADEYEQLMTDLKAWAAQAEHGDQRKLAKSLGVSPQRLNSWVKGLKEPNGKAAFSLKSFLAKWKKSAKQI
jgi:hypothetical protein